MPLFDDSRAAWGAARNTNPRSVPPSARVGISWHYDGGAALNLASRPHSACLTRVKADQRFHQSTARGWADIGYNGLICQHGRAIEGRGADLQGAHSPGVNYTHYGIQFMVGGSELPTPAAYARAARLAADLAAHSGRSLRQWGHRDDPAASTACPGNGIEAWVKRQGSASPLLSKPTNPQPAPVPEEDIMASIADLDAAITKRIPDIVKAVTSAIIWGGNIEAPASVKAKYPDAPKWGLGSFAAYGFATAEQARDYARVAADPSTVAAAVVAALPSAQGQVTQETVEAALRNVLGSLAPEPDVQP